MIGRSQNEARRASLALFQRAVSWVSKAVVQRGHTGDGVSDFWSLGDRSVPLGGRYRLAFSFHHPYNVREALDPPGHWAVRSAGYFYHLRELDGPEIIAFHWHPGRRGQPEFPTFTSRAESTRSKSPPRTTCRPVASRSRNSSSGRYAAIGNAC
jgi:hypothetical protein